MPPRPPRPCPDTPDPAAPAHGVLDVGVVGPGADELSAAAYVELGRLVEREGFHTFTIGEIAGYDAFAVLAAVAATTSRVRLGTGVVPIYTRSPVLASMGFASLAAIAPGRVVAGLGTGSHRIVEDWQGRRLERPLETMDAYIAILRTALAGERVDVADGPLPVDGYRLQHPPVRPVPVFIGAFKPRMLRLAGAVADGVILSLFPPDQLAPLIAEVRRGAEDAGRDPAEVEILATVHAYAGPDVDEAVEKLRRTVLQYAVRPTHRPAFEGTFPEIDRATVLWERGDRRGALALVPDEAVHHAFAIGDAGRTVERIELARSAGVTLPIIEPMALRRGEAEAPLATVSAVAAELRQRRRALGALH